MHARFSHLHVFNAPAEWVPLGTCGSKNQNDASTVKNRRKSLTIVYSFRQYVLWDRRTGCYINIALCVHCMLSCDKTCTRCGLSRDLSTVSVTSYNTRLLMLINTDDAGVCWVCQPTSTSDWFRLLIMFIKQKSLTTINHRITKIQI